MIILQINECLNGSTGSIARQIGDLAAGKGWDSWIAYSSYEKEIYCKSHLITIGSKQDYLLHALQTRLFDNHGLASQRATRRLLKEIDRITPSIIHLHNIHGYYLNYKILFKYLAQRNIPIIWTLHDCWPMTGHCAYFSHVKCQKWKNGCNHCPEVREYPKAYIDRSAKNWVQKKLSFTSIPNLTIVTVSDWLADIVRSSFLSSNKVQIIKNGVDINTFKSIPINGIKTKYGIEEKIVLLAVSFFWDFRKGLDDYIKLSRLLDKDYVIFLVGLSKAQIEGLPSNIIGIERTESLSEMISIYNMADVVLSLSYGETFGMTIAEGMACGKPAIVYDNTALPELITPETGRVVPTGDIYAITQSLKEISAMEKKETQNACRNRAEQHFNKDDRFMDYIKLYSNLLQE